MFRLILGTRTLKAVGLDMAIGSAPADTVVATFALLAMLELLYGALV